MMRRFILLASAVAMVVGIAPARAETSNWATYAVATTQYSDGNLAGAAFPLLGTVFCLVDNQTVCPPSPDDVVAGVTSAVDNTNNGSWAAMQATGEPDTYPSCGDIPTAWTPLPSGNEPGIVGQEPVAEPEALGLIYDPPVDGATRVDIYETNLGGFVTQVDVVLADGTPVTVFTGPDPTSCPGILSIPVSTSLPVAAVVVHTAKVGWEEIDAVAVVN
jgi:hypothetical protein